MTVTQITEEDLIQGNEGRENNQRGEKELLGERKKELERAKIDLDIEEMQQDSLRKRKTVEEQKDTEEARKGNVEEINESDPEEEVSSEEGSFDEKDWNEEEEENGSSRSQSEGEDQEWSNVENNESNSKETGKGEERNQSKDKKREIPSIENGTDKEKGDTLEESEEEQSQSGRDGIGQDTGSILRGRGRRAVEEKKRILTDVKIRIYEKRKGQMIPRNKIMALLTNIRHKDEAAVMVHDGLKIQKETEIPTGSDSVKAFQVTYDREENTYLKLTLETKKNLRVEVEQRQSTDEVVDRRTINDAH